jgi:DNA-binding transcriptional LysR family regulator
MHRRHDKINIPIELLRSFVAIQELGSFTKAAATLQLTQPAISAQIKRLQQLVGGEVFSRNGLGIALTEKGEIISKYARRILAMNDQIMSLSGAKLHARHFRVGIPNVYAARMLFDVVKASANVEQTDRIQFCCEPSGDLLKSLTSGYLDLAFIVSAAPPHAQPIIKWIEKPVWVCSRDFLLSPGSPIPILSWPNAVSDQAAIEALENFGLQYTVAFVASDLAAQLAAIRSGLGFFVFPERVVPSDMKIAREHYLPRLPDLTGGLYLREGLDAKRMAPVIECLDSVLNPDRASAGLFPQDRDETRPPKVRKGAA